MNKQNLMMVFLSFVIFFSAGAYAAVGSTILDGVEINSGGGLHLWRCEDRMVFDDPMEPGRLPDEELLERINNYMFEGEQISWPSVLVLNVEGTDHIDNVYVTVGDHQGEGNPIKANCHSISVPQGGENPSEFCGARINQEHIEEFNPDTMGYYECTLTTETSDSMYGESWVTVEAADIDGALATIDENEFWFFNPIVGLSVDSEYPLFDNLEPGETYYSPNISIGNAADQGSGVIMDIFISGTDFYDNSGNLSYCPNENVLNLSRFSYYAENREYDTLDLPDSDNEGYRPIKYGEEFNIPETFYDTREVIPKDPVYPYYLANILDPNNDINLRLKLDVPELCQGNFNDGMIIFWAEAI